MRVNRSGVLAGLLLATLAPGQTEGEPRIEIVHEIPLDRRGAARLVHLGDDELLVVTEIGVVEIRSWPELELQRREPLRIRTRMHLIDAMEAGSFYCGTPRSRIESVVYFADTMEIVTLADGELRRHRSLFGSFRGGLSVELSARAAALRAEPDHGVSFVRPRRGEDGADAEGFERVWLDAALDERRSEAVEAGVVVQAHPPTDAPAHPAAVLAVSRRGEDAVVARADGVLQVRHDGCWTTRDDLPLAPTRMQFSRDGRRALVTSPTAWQVVDVETGESSWESAPYAAGAVRGLFPGRGGAELLVVVDERVDLFHAAAGRVVVTGLVSLPAGQRPLAVDAAGARMITSGDLDHAIVDLESGRVTAHPGAAAAATFRHGTGESWVWIRREEFGASSIERRARDGRRLDTLAVDASRVIQAISLTSHVRPPSIAVAPSGGRVLLRDQLGGFVGITGLPAGVDPAICDDLAAFLGGEREVLLAAGVRGVSLVDVGAGEILATRPRDGDESGWVVSPDACHLLSIGDADSVAVLRIRVVRDQ